MSLRERWEGVTGSVRAYFEGLNDRERTLLGLLGVVAVGVFVVLPMYLALDSIATREVENRELAAFLTEVEQQGEVLRRRKAELDAMRSLFEHEVPALAGFLDSQKGSLEIREVTDQPDQEVFGFNRRRVNAQFPAADHEAMIRMLAEIDASPFPVSISRIEADRIGGAADSAIKYNFRVGVDAYVRPNAARRGATP